MFSIEFADALLREDIIMTFKDGMTSEDPRIAMSAAKDLNALVFKKDDDDKGTGIIPDMIILKGKKPE